MKEKAFDFNVNDRQSFADFITALHKDLRENPEGWKNKTLPDFLEALSSYTEDIQGYYDNMKIHKDADKPNWEIFADIFKGAIIYE
ncbi:hypothetical protein OIU83_11615 [Flavobacterium sp. LS1R49]|uniref:DUF7660 domain-containing protein n=1 Tax=Flavobacterium shii TaxID=2987687 RepID=A0A9X2YV90_9FLAO|nr:hypothetical protein [Flavobacterium shii]MCV9928308.1 hypothetical protein [Flavobacterium shii]